VNTSSLIVIIVGVLFLGLIWRIVKGVIRFVLTIGVLLVFGYIVLNALR